MPEVTIVGAGIAGLIAALRLLERDYHVTLFEQNGFIGGKLAAPSDDTLPDAAKGVSPAPGRHEHSYHFFLNWYNNFWKLVHELDIADHFEPRRSLRYIRRGAFPRTEVITDYGSPSTYWDNLFSGLVPAPDLFLAMYSVLDLLGQPFDRDDFLDNYSVNGFMRSRDYATPTSAGVHNLTLAKAFAVPSFHTSAASYKSFLKYSFPHPAPMMWVLKGDKQTQFLDHLERKLATYGSAFDLKTRHRLNGIELDDDNKVSALVFHELAESPACVHPMRPAMAPATDGAPHKHVVDGDLILALPAQTLGPLLPARLLRSAPPLANIRHLRSEPMASIDLHFRTKLADIPREHCILMGSKYEMSFVDNSQLWPDIDHTFLNVVASEIDGLLDKVVLGDLEPDEVDESIVYANRGQPERRKTERREADRFATDQRAIDLLSARQLGRNVPVDLDQPKTVLDFLLKHLAEYVPFDADQLDLDQTHIRFDTGDSLFVNDVGSWQRRPETTTDVPNLFLAGDYCRTCIDVVTVEGALVSGLQAAEAIRRRDQIGAPIDIIEPDVVPEIIPRLMTFYGRPLAYGAKLWSELIRP